ncbi:hypothetical protein FisN_16Lh020 [Fistulifera solaris]|uniref:RNA helicase n=1 Tax=Fistulifera solaris TaxID=1519565 RepID=A0A1Z5KIS4_FISSO|nr:hypothetical protein FisN_16Lh020 [Fistulifera solaris]|eukprot:GAX26203.1 hypothetical protein FisN_16Lh020 [Fistulifera solaris]
MPKKGKTPANNGKTTPKCTCQDPYKCECGHRPERPSKGHKWDPETQTWGGKGHKQKGASGQTASIAQKATTTAVGQTSVAQWQRMPSQLLQEYCKKNKRPLPKLENKSKNANAKCLYKVILADGKNTQKDLFFQPMHAVGNEEQAREEACLLALLSLTPNLPHERTLPEPYRTTWLHAIASVKERPSLTTTPTPEQSTTTQKAQASKELKLATTFTSKAEQKRLLEEKRKLKNQRMQRHEAIRRANKDHVVSMSAAMRRQIERLLRGEHVDWDEMSSEEEEQEDPAQDDLAYYVQDRLHREGFTRKQARAAFRQVEQGRVRDNHDSNNEDEWDVAFEECLQWLLVNVDEDQLPEGIDPDKGNVTLDNNVAPTNAASAELGAQWGLSNAEVKLVQARVDDNLNFESVLWSMLVEKAGVILPETNLANISPEQREINKSLFQEEVEALEAIYSADFKLQMQSSGLHTIEIVSCHGEMVLRVLIREGVYPLFPPEKVWLTGSWGSRLVGSAYHMELVKFLADLPLSDPMIFELHGHAQIMFETLDDLPSQQLIDVSSLNSNKRRPNNLQRFEEIKFDKVDAFHMDTTKHTRPREGKPFWSQSPSQTPEATPFPKISTAIEMARKSLPAAKARDDFLQLLRQAGESGRVLLLTGETGCGKTTQIPQFILEEYPKDSKIVVAQPRRLAATGVASRVAAERGESKLGKGSVGYVVRGDSAICEKSRLVFCTTGVLLRQMQSNGALDCITHVVVDEVHERHLDTDVLLGLLKQYLTIYPHLRVILMSATLDADRFANYWVGNTPRMQIPGRTFPVKDYMLEDVLSLTGYVPRRKNFGFRRGFGPKRSTPWADSEMSEDEDGVPSDLVAEPKVDATVAQPMRIDDIMKRIDENYIDYDLLAALVSHLVRNKPFADNGSILIFLPGAPEINKAIEAIQHAASDLPIRLFPLHGGLQPQEQNKVFLAVEKGFTKIIASTNVAETSITIPDCTIVIDSAKEKQSSYDPANRMPLLLEQFASKASLNQRRGRAGRVREGTCFKLISNTTYHKLHEHSEPEIRRSALEQTLLSLLYLGVESGTGDFFRSLIDPPTVESILAAESTLIQLSAVERVNTNLHLTPLGLHLAGIPAPPMIGKMLIMGCILGCRDASLAMAAGMSLGRSPFIRIDSNPKTKEPSSTFNLIALKNRTDLIESVGDSDHAVLAAVYSQWKVPENDSSRRRSVCDALGLSFSVMRDMDQLVKQLDSALVSLGFPPSADSNQNGKLWRVVRACAVAALAPSQLVKVVRPAAKFEKTTEGAKEIEAHARELKFFIRAVRNLEQKDNSLSEERVFIHPSSANFSAGDYSCPWLVFHSMVRTSKPFLRDVTECNSYSLLLFGGPLEVKASKSVVSIDGWVQLSANARIGALMGGLRRKVDELLSQKVRDPSLEIASTEEMRLIIKLITRDGQN